MKESTFEMRYAKVLNNEDDKECNNRRVAINIIGTLPILAGTFMDRISGDDGASYGLIDSITTDTPHGKKDNKNFLYDDEKDTDGNLVNPDRYVFLGNAQSMVSKLFASIYYDALFNDIIVIPDIYSLGIEDENIDFYKDNEMTLNAYSVGRGQFKDRPFKELTIPIDQIDSDGMPQPDKFDKTKTLLVTTYGLAINSLCTSNTTVVNDGGETSYIGADKVVPLQYIQFPDNSDIYDEVPPLNTHNLIQQTHAGLSVDFVGKRLITKMMIPLNF